MTSIIIKRRKKQVILRNTMLKMHAMQCKIELENGIGVTWDWRPPMEEEESEEEEEEPKTKRAKIEMETASNSIQDLFTNEVEETEEAKAKRVKIEIETTLKAIRDSVTKVKKAEDNNMNLVEALDLTLPRNSNNAQTSTGFDPIEFKSVSDLTLHMANFSLCEIPISNDEFDPFPPHVLRRRKWYPDTIDFLPFVRLPKSAQLPSSPYLHKNTQKNKNTQQVQTEQKPARAQPNTDHFLSYFS